MHRWIACALLAMVFLAAPGTVCPADPPAAPRITVLDSGSVWRIHSTLRPPVVRTDAGIVPVTSPYEWVDRETPAPPVDWTAPGFADGGWLRGRAAAGPLSPYVSNLHLRARFEVTDPAQVRDLRVSVAYHGGTIVRVNGREVARGHLAKEAPGALMLAEDYPRNAFVTDDGKIIPERLPSTLPAGVADRVRRLPDVPVPPEALVRGVNVLSVEVVRAPYDRSVYEYWSQQPRDTRELGDKNLPYDFNWHTCQLREVELSAGSGDGLVPNAARPDALQAWTNDLLSHDYASDFGDRCDPLREVAIRGPRNGWSSGKIVLGSPRAIEELKVACSDLTLGSSRIPASAVRVRFAVARRPGDPLDMLLEQPLPSFPAAGGGAVVPVWLTVRVPRDAAPGTYAGQARIEAKDAPALTVPVTLEVAGFAVPDTQDYVTWIELMQSPDTLALEYGVPLWSERHWQLMEASLRYIAEIGSRVVHIPLIAQANLGNEEGMVRFIRNPDGTYRYDLSVALRYLDLAVKHMGRPKFVAFHAWEVYLSAPPGPIAEQDYEREFKLARAALKDKGPAVTVLDPATGRVSAVHLPRYEDPASRGIWKPLFDELRREMAKRGLEDTMLLGMASDLFPNKEELETLQAVSGNLDWINHTHQGAASQGGKIHGGMAKAAYIAYVWPNVYPNDPSKGRLHGWKRPELWVEFRRFGSLNEWPLPAMMLFPEIQITGGQRGLGRIGADFWAVLADQRGNRRGHVWTRYPQSYWHSCNLSSHMLSPGPEGPVARTRYEMLREGLQQCEARIAIEKVLTEPSLRGRLDPALALRAQELLDDRIWEQLKAFSGLQLTGRLYTTYPRYQSIFGYNAGGAAGSRWYAGSGWQDRAQRLYALADEVRRKAGGE